MTAELRPCGRPPAARRWCSVYPRMRRSMWENAGIAGVRPPGVTLTAMCESRDRRFGRRPLEPPAASIRLLRRTFVVGPVFGFGYYSSPLLVTARPPISNRSRGRARLGRLQRPHERRRLCAGLQPRGRPLDGRTSASARHARQATGYTLYTLQIMLHYFRRRARRSPLGSPAISWNSTRSGRGCGWSCARPRRPVARRQRAALSLRAAGGAKLAPPRGAKNRRPLLHEMMQAHAALPVPPQAGRGISLKRR